MLDFYHTYYAPGNATLVIAGNITPEAGLALAQKDLRRLARARRFPTTRPCRKTPQTDIRTRNLTAPVRHGFLQIGFRAPSVQDKPDAWVMDVLMTLLGQGGNNRLEQDLQRKQKLVTAISTNYLTQRDPGTMSVTAEFDPGDYRHRARGDPGRNRGPARHAGLAGNWPPPSIAAGLLSV